MLVVVGAAPPPDPCALRQAPLPPCNLWASRLPLGPANEVHVAVDPTNPAHFLAVAKDYALGANPDCRPSGAFHVASAAYVTFDGGKSWATSRVPAPYPGAASPSPLRYKCGSDPVAAFGPDGTAYYVLLNFQYAGGRQASIAVARSPDGGLSWPASEIRVLHTSGGDDKEWGTVTADGRVHVVWTDVSTGYVWYARTTTSYDSWQIRQIARAGGGNPAVVVAGGPASEVYVAWRDSGAIKFTKSTDGGATQSTIRTAFTTSPYESGGPPRLPFMPQIAVDAGASSPYRGSIYVTWPGSSGGGDVYLAYSRDGGTSWSAAVKVSDDSSNRRQAMPTVSVAPNGRVDLAWLDQRLAPSPDFWNAFTASSGNGGASFTANRLAQDVALNEEWSRHQDGSVFIGDYMGIASTAAAAWPIFPGNGADRLPDLGAQKLQRADAYVAPVPDPVAVTAAADAAWRGPIASVEVGDVPLGAFEPGAVFLD